MPRQGRLLEILLKHIQQYLGPEGIKIRSPEEFFRDGRKIGEIDVTLRGDFGSSRIFVGIECRDRPSEPPQGREWIREIKGKKDDLGVHKMIAVSTTSFTPQAVDLASQFDIDLLHVQTVDQLDLHDWFKPLTFSWHEVAYKITGTIDIGTEHKNLMRTLPFTLKTPYFKIGGGDHPVSLSEIIESRLDAVLTAPQFQNSISNAVLEIKEPIDIEYQGATYKATRMAIPLQLSRQVFHAKALLNVCKRLSDNEMIAMTGYCRIEIPRLAFNVLAVAKRSKSDPSKTNLRVHFLTDDNKPFQLPAGTHIALFGLQDGSLPD